MAEQIETLLVEFRADIKRYEAQLQRQVRATNAAAAKNVAAWKASNRKVQVNFQQTASRIRSSYLTIGAALAAGFGTKVIADFGQAMASVKAVTGATEFQFQALREEAKRLGATTRYSATEAAEAMLFLGRAGFTTDEILASVGPTLNLAQVGMIDLGAAADIASNILQGFRLEASEMQRVVDVMAKTVNSSNTDVRQLGDGMKLVAPVAAGLGVSLEETSAAVGALSNAGLQATLAGTGLRRVLSELESPTAASQKILKQYGVALEDVQPTAVGLTSALQRLKDAGIDTGDALKLFGQRGGPAFEVLSSSIDDIREMNAAFNDAEGTAKQMAKIMDDTLAGAMKKALSRLQDLVIALGDAGAEQALIDMFNGLAAILTSMSQGVADLSAWLAQFKSEAGKASDATYAYAEALHIANEASGEAKQSAEDMVKLTREAAVASIEAAKSKLIEAEAELELARARRDRMRERSSFSPTAQKGGLIATEYGFENQSRAVTKLREAVATLEKDLSELDSGTSDLLVQVKQGFERELGDLEVNITPVSNDGDDSFKDMLEDLGKAFEEAKRQVGSEIGLLDKLRDARDKMHGQQLAIIDREYEARRIQIERDIKNEERKAEALKLLAEERAEYERQARAEVLGQGANSDNPVEVMRAEEAAKLDALKEALDLQLITVAEHEARRAEIIEATEERIQKARGASAVQQISAYQNLFGSMADLAKNFAGEQSGIYKALFAVEKAFAIASSIIAIQTGVANAMSLPFPANLGAAATVAAQGASVVANIRAVSAFRDGGIDIGGPGTGRSDSIPAMISAGESVITAKGTSKNKTILAAINAGADVQGALGSLGGQSTNIDASVTIGSVTNDSMEEFKALLNQQRDQILQAVPGISRATRQDDKRRGRL